jgi:hypothetical protein
MIQSLLDAKTDMAKALAAVIRPSLARQDTDHIAFHGCIDWHSAVHGAWALTAYTRMTGDRQYEPFIGEVLSPEKIAGERAYLADRPEFEMPYGRAWFLRLAGEHRQTFGTDALEPMADDVLASLLARYQRHKPNPQVGSYHSDSWALLNMLDYAESSKNTAAAEQVRTLVNEHFVRSTAGCGYHLEHPEFMAVVTNWAWLVSRVLEPEEFERWAQALFARTGLPEPVTDPISCHHHGLNFSRAWGLWALHAASRSPEARTAYQAAYAAHFRQNFDRPEWWCGSYESVGHWVPQFGMLALQPLFFSRGAEV